MQEENKKLFEFSRADNWKLQAAIMDKMEDREQKFLSKIKRKLEATSEKLQEIHESVSKRITGVEERVSHLEKTIDTKVNCLKTTFVIKWTIWKRLLTENL